MKGILLVDKPSGMTSHDVVDRIRRASGIRRVGHTGTLDPSATGLLILCLGPATRLSEFLIGLDKVYEGAMKFGVVTDSYDMDGAVTEEHEIPPLTETAIQAVFDRFTGPIMQVPPMVSAVRIGGKRLYAMARKGAVVEREARAVTVREFTLLRYEAPFAHFRVRCTRGTYARVLAYDVGGVLNCGATLASLRRTHVGPHSISDAAPLDSFQTRDDVTQRLLPVEKALDLPQVVVRKIGLRLVASGGTIGLREILGDCPIRQGWIQLKSERGDLLALGEVEAADLGVRIHPKRVVYERS